MRLVGGPRDGEEGGDSPANILMVPVLIQVDVAPEDWERIIFHSESFTASLDGEPIAEIEQHEYRRDGDVWRYVGKRG